MIAELLLILHLYNIKQVIMKSQKLYEADDKLISLIKDNYNVLQSLGAFGINLGFGDKTVREVCEMQWLQEFRGFLQNLHSYSYALPSCQP